MQGDLHDDEFTEGICRVIPDDRYAFKMTFYCEQKLLLKREYLIDKFNCDSLSAFGRGDYFPSFPTFGGCSKPESIVNIEITSHWGVPTDADIHALQRFENVISFMTGETSLNGQYKKLFPKLEYLWVSNWRVNPMRDFHTYWPHLKHVRIDKYKSDPAELGDIDLLTLHLFWPKQTNYAALSKFDTLETLYLYSTSDEIDVSIFSNMPNLKHLKIEKCKNIVGWENLHSSSIEIIELDKLCSLEDLKGLPNLKGVYIDRLENPKKKWYRGQEDKARNWPIDALYYPAFDKIKPK